MGESKKQSKLMAIVSDTGPIIAFSRITRVTLLNKVFGEVYIPEAVRTEILQGGSRPGTKEIQECGWFKTVKVKDIEAVKKLNQFIGLGESEAIVLSNERDLPLLCDDEQARKMATQMGHKYIIGNCTLLAEAKKLGLIKSIDPIFRELTLADYWLSKDIIRETLKKVGEI